MSRQPVKRGPRALAVSPWLVFLIYERRTAMRYLSSALFLLTLSSTSFAKQSVVWNGLTHDPEGQANLSVTASGNLLVDNLGSSGLRWR